MLRKTKKKTKKKLIFFVQRIIFLFKLLNVFRAVFYWPKKVF